MAQNRRSSDSNRPWASAIGAGNSQQAHASWYGFGIHRPERLLQFLPATEHAPDQQPSFRIVCRDQ